jgi:DNA-binding LytR/AlgR family response regulator
MRKISCLAVDDEPPALSLVEGYIRRTPFLELKGAFGSAQEALEFLGSQPVDLVFLDIQMPDFSGMALSKLIKGGPRAIFTTAFDQYALEGYRVDALDYLLKPFDYEEFLRASSKALNLAPGMPQAPVVEQEFIFVKSEYKYLKVALREVAYFEGWKDYVKIHLKDRPKPLLSLMSLKSLEEKLPPDQFMRIHRSYIVGLRHIDSVERGRVVVAQFPITIADAYRDAFQHYLNQQSI